jgi:hypothetical protein
LVELSVVEQRYKAVLEVIRDGVPIVQVARRFDVSRLEYGQGRRECVYGKESPGVHSGSAGPLEPRSVRQQGHDVGPNAPALA